MKKFFNMFNNDKPVDDLETPSDKELNEEKQMMQEGKEQPENSVEETAEPENELDKLRKEKDELADKYMRLQAEFDNFRKRNVKERIELLQSASQDMMIAVLPILDDFERAVKSMEAATDVEALKEGIILIHAKMKNILTQKGLKTIESVGQQFNIDFHEAITNVPVEEEERKNIVVDEVERGYMLGDKVIRFAKVVVGS